ncbi:class I adenylate-forming enzyme family protein [Rhizohabitans arisaemae]|uniref:class I adenylate-forming enzyme family protein n=1 Tax=Rhizohabitans arisaemae TaxID=2720610 RepID=UPI0024B21917|nr:class I adenylate-forming enzyme family protein [Rhizohabitans arisaemae]
MSDLVGDLLRTCDKTPEATALIDGKGRALPFGELGRRVRAVRDGLIREGLRRSDGVLFAVRPGPDAVALALGIVAAGGVLVFADPGLAPGVLDARLRTIRPRWVTAESLLYLISGTPALSRFARRRGLLLPKLADPIPRAELRHLYTGPWLPGIPRGAVRLRGLLRGDAAERSSAGPPDDPAVVIFTSGTTARPRAVVHTRRSLAAGLTLFQERVPLDPGDVVHTDQLMLGLPALIAGATWSLPGRPGRFAAELAERRATHTFGVPIRLARLVETTPRLPATLRHILLGTAPAPPDLLRRIAAAAPHAQVASVYALTEALPVAVVTAEEKLAHTGGGDLLGAPLPGVGATLTDEGELLITGPHTARGYLGEEPLTRIATGDLVRIDDQGRLIMLGRKKDMLLRDGFNIYPGLYEPAVAALPGVREAALIGLPDPATGDEEIVLALRADPGLDLDRLRALLPGVVDAGALPDRIAVLDDFPRTGRAAKLDRPALRRLLTDPAGATLQ